MKNNLYIPVTWTNNMLYGNCKNYKFTSWQYLTNTNTKINHKYQNIKWKHILFYTMLHDNNRQNGTAHSPSAAANKY
jgi:hypothetical protein